MFTIVNVAAIILRKDHSPTHDYFHAPRVLPYLGAITCAYLVGPWAQDLVEYQIAVVLLLIGLGLWIVNFVYDRLFLGRKVRFEHPEALARMEDEPADQDPHRGP